MESIPNGLRATYVVQFIFSLIFGLAGVVTPKLVGKIAGHPVTDLDVNMLMGAAALMIAVGSWLAYRATKWEQIRIFTVASAFFGLLGGVGGLLFFFVPALFGSGPVPPVQLVVSFLLLLLGIAFAYFYNRVNKLKSPLGAK